MPSRLPIALLLLLLAAPLARAAQLTDTASAADVNNDWDFNVDVGYQFHQRRGLITGEQQIDGNMADARWMRFAEYSNRMLFRWAAGLYHDLEIHGTLNYRFDDEKNWRYAMQFNQSLEPFWKTDAQQALVNNDGEALSGASEVFAPGQSFRKGMGDPSFGLAWGILSDKRDPTKPTWVFSADYTPAIVRNINPTVATTATDPGAIGDRVHRIKMSTSLSKRLKIADPYVQLHYTLPIARDGVSYDACRDENFKAGRGITATRVTATNCADPNWAGKTIISPAHEGGFIMGTELVAYDNTAGALTKVSFDLRFSGTYFSEARTYSELSDALRRLTYVEQYMNVEAGIGFNVKGKYFQFRAMATLGTDTPHLITGESLGRDFTALGQPGEGQIELATATNENAPEQNPLFDYRIDSPGRRLRITETSVFNLTVFGSVNF